MSVNDRPWLYKSRVYKPINYPTLGLRGMTRAEGSCEKTVAWGVRRKAPRNHEAASRRRMHVDSNHPPAYKGFARS